MKIGFVWNIELDNHVEVIKFINKVNNSELTFVDGDHKTITVTDGSLDYVFAWGFDQIRFVSSNKRERLHFYNEVTGIWESQENNQNCNLPFILPKNFKLINMSDGHVSDMPVDEYGKVMCGFISAYMDYR